MNPENTYIGVSKATREALKAIGSKGETYDTIISNLLQNRRQK